MPAHATMRATIRRLEHTVLSQRHGNSRAAGWALGAAASRRDARARVGCRPTDPLAGSARVVIRCAAGSTVLTPKRVSSVRRARTSHSPISRRAAPIRPCRPWADPAIRSSPPKSCARDVTCRQCRLCATPDSISCKAASKVTKIACMPMKPRCPAESSVGDAGASWLARVGRNRVASTTPTEAAPNRACFWATRRV